MLDLKKQNKDYKFINFKDDLEILFPQMIDYACSNKVRFLFDNYKNGDPVWLALSLKDSTITFLDENIYIRKGFDLDNIVITKIEKSEDVFENFEDYCGRNITIVKEKTLKSILNLEFKRSSEDRYRIRELIYEFLDKSNKLCYELKLGDLSVNYFHFNFFKNNKILSNYFLKFLKNQFEKFEINFYSSNNNKKVDFIIQSAWLKPLINESNKNDLAKLLIDYLKIYKENRIFRIYEWTSFYDIYLNDIKDPVLTKEFLNLLTGMEADPESFIPENSDSDTLKSFKKDIIKLLNENKILLNNNIKVKTTHPILRSDELFFQFCNLLKSIKNNVIIEINLVDEFKIGIQSDNMTLQKLKILKELQTRMFNLSFKNLNHAITIYEIKEELSNNL